MSGSATMSVGMPAANHIGDTGTLQNGRVRRMPALSRPARVLTNITYLLITIMLGYSLWVRDEGHITAESGLGYALGIAGATVTLALLTYPLRKRFRFMRNWGSVPTWFHFHMLLGIVAPALILAHSSFHFGSLNSSIALISMLLVAGSGVIGRYVYVRIHFGLYGAKATLEGLRAAVEDEGSRIGIALSFAPALRDRLFKFAAKALAPKTNVLLAAIRILFIGIRIHWVRFIAYLSLSWNLRREAKRLGWSSAVRRQTAKNTRKFIRDYLGGIRKTVQFTFYERLFALWHVLHIPLFFMLLIATSVHIVAVHMY
jgi:hypothetical protein